VVEAGGAGAGLGKTAMTWLRHIERLLLLVGVLMLAFYVAARIHRTVLSNADLQRFKSQQTASAAGPRPVTLTAGTPDFSLWSEKRVKEYQESLAAHFAPAIGILRIPKIHVEVPILEGTDDLSLNRGVGHVAGTANPGEQGNVAIAGHRDGFFRGLKDIVVGDQIEVVTLQGTVTYTIDRITIVERTDLSVLQSRSRPSLTLITCYPFYFIGSAPQRYIVQASVSGSSAANDHPAVESENESVHIGNSNEQAVTR
jgi:sortase A